MTESLDIYLMPIYRQVGQDQPVLPGLYTAEPPRHTARGRSHDRLILYFSTVGNAPLSPAKLEQVLERLSQTFFKTPGSVTAALRTVAETLNHFLLDRNLRNASTGRQATGILTLIVIREENLYMSQSGPTHAFVALSGQTEHLFDPQLSGRGLGLSRTAPLRYFQARLHPGDTFLLAAQPSPSWNAASLTGISGQGLDSLRRRLFARADLELNAIVLQARPGHGKLHQVSPGKPATVNGEATEVPLPPLPDLSPETLASLAAETAAAPDVGAGRASTANSPEAAGPGSMAPDTLPPAPDAGTIETPAAPGAAAPGSSAGAVFDFSQDLAASQARQPEKAVPAAEQAAPLPPVPTSLSAVPTAAHAGTQNPTASPPLRRRSRPQPDFASVRKFIAALILGLNRSFNSLFRGARVASDRMMPTESMGGLPPAWMGFIAVAVPVVVVSVASMVYFQRGLTAEYRLWFKQAQDAATLAVSQQDQSMGRVVWETTLQYLDQADSYQRTDESEALRAQALTALDELNMVKRLAYQDAVIGGLPDNVKVSRLVISNDDLYMLDAHSGSVMRGLVTNSQDYEIDRAFQCGPGSSGSYLIGSIVDISQPPLGSDPSLVILAMDTNGTLLNCYADRPPETRPLARPQTASNWGSLVAYTLDPDLGHFYLLDPVDNAVWAYWGSNFEEEPTFFFGNDVPDLSKSIEMSVDGGDLYILQEDGSMTLCTYSQMAVSPTRCAEGVPYIDTRAGQAGARMDIGGGFSQVFVSQPPDPSLYLLAPREQAIYRYNLRTLNYHRQFLPDRGLPEGDATAFTIDTNRRIVYLAVGDRVYQAAIP